MSTSILKDESELCKKKKHQLTLRMNYYVSLKISTLILKHYKKVYIIIYDNSFC